MFGKAVDYVEEASSLRGQRQREAAAALREARNAMLKAAATVSAKLVHRMILSFLFDSRVFMMRSPEVASGWTDGLWVASGSVSVRSRDVFLRVFVILLPPVFVLVIFKG